MSSVPLIAALDDLSESPNRRYAARRTLSLVLPGSTPSGIQARVVVHDISRTGLLVETNAKLAVGEELQVVLPQAGDTNAVVLWSSGSFFGCQFTDAISPAAVSAAVLQSPPPTAETTKPAEPSLPQWQAAGAEQPEHRYPLSNRLRIIAGLAVGSWSLILVGANLIF